MLDRNSEGQNWSVQLGGTSDQRVGSVAPPVSQLAARLSQPIMSDTASSNQLRSLLQRPYGSATPHAATESASGMLLTHSSSASPMVGGTPVSTTRVWVPGSYSAELGVQALDNMAVIPSTQIMHFNWWYLLEKIHLLGSGVFTR